MEKLKNIGVGNRTPSKRIVKDTTPVYQAELDKVIDKVNEIIDDFVEFNSQTGTSYTLALTDTNKYLRLLNAEPITLIIPLNSGVEFTIGTVIAIEQTGAGAVTATAEDGVIINGNVLSAGQFNILVLIKTAINTWTCIGGTT